MTSRSFRRLFPQLNIQSVPADEFYRQASLSQLLTGPDEQELASLRSEVKEWVELVEATPELAAMLGSSHEFVDSRWDASRPPAPPPLEPPPCLRQSFPPVLKSRTIESSPAPGHLVGLPPVGPLDSSSWEKQKNEDPKATMAAGWWSRGQNPETNVSADPDPAEPQQRSKGRRTPGPPPMKQRRRRVHEDPTPALVPSQETGSLNPEHLKDETNRKVQNQSAGEATEAPRLTSENRCRSKLDLRDPQEARRTSGTAANQRDTTGVMADAAWQRNLTSVRVHLRDLGVKIANIQRDAKRVAGKTARVQTRS